MTFKNANGNWILAGLFLETSYNDKTHVIYTLKDDDYVLHGKKYISIKRLYLLEEDPTEYQVATKYFGGWKHWKALCDSPTLQEHIEDWREELEVKLRSEGVRAMITKASDASDKNSFSAAKYLSDKGWQDKKVGRPSKADIDNERKKQANVKSKVVGDLERLRVIRNGETK